MKNVVIIGQSGNPIPAVNGGAVETLITSLVEQNERLGELRLTVISPYDEKAERVSYKYENTAFKFIKTGGKSLRYKILRALGLTKLYPGMLDTNYIVAAYDYIRALPQVDLVIVEENSNRCTGYRALARDFAGRLVYHSHIDEGPAKRCFYDRVICISDFCARNWRGRLAPENVSVLPNGINIAKFSQRITAAERTALRERLGVGADDFLLLFCGRLMWEKGVRELIQAVLGLEDTHVKLLICGSASFAQANKTKYVCELESLVSGHEQQIIFTGYIDNSELYRYYQSADVQVVPSMWEEAAGLVAIEGMLSGLPLIVTRSGGMVEYVGDCAYIIERDGIVANLEQAIHAVRADADWRRQASIAGRERAQSFSEERYYEDFVTLVGELTAGSSSGIGG